MASFPEEEDPPSDSVECFDAFNDDTFGDGAEVWEEDAHEELAKLTEGEKEMEKLSLQASSPLSAPPPPPDLHHRRHQPLPPHFPPPAPPAPPAGNGFFSDPAMAAGGPALGGPAHGGHGFHSIHIHNNGMTVRDIPSPGFVGPAIMSMGNVPPPHLLQQHAAMLPPHPAMGAPPPMPPIMNGKTVQELEEDMIRQQQHRQQQMHRQQQQQQQMRFIQQQQQHMRQQQHQQQYRRDQYNHRDNFHQDHHHHHRRHDNNNYHHRNNQQRNYHHHHQQRRANNNEMNRYNERNRDTFGDEMVDSYQNAGAANYRNNLITPGHVHALGILRGNAVSTGIPQLDMMRETKLFDRQSDSFDDFSGLMSQKERQWVINIQLSQLKCENPFVDDHYYTVYNQKKEEENNNDGNNQMKRTEEGPQLLLNESSIVHEENKNYTPKQFDNSLGKLQAITVKAPRKIIDVGIVNNDLLEGGSTSAQKDSRKFKQTLMELEHLYSLLIEVEDCEKKLGALPTNTTMRNQVESDRLEATQRLGVMLTAEGRLRRYLLVRKGKTLIGRSLRHIDGNKVQMVMATLCQLLPTAVRRDRDDLLLPSRIWPELKKHLVLSPPSIILHYLKQCNTGLATFKSVLGSALGLSIITTSLSLLFDNHNAENDDDEVDEKEKSCLLKEIGSALTETKEIPQGLSDALYINTVPKYIKDKDTRCQLERLIIKV